jgi:hypothetical protein
MGRLSRLASKGKVVEIEASLGLKSTKQRKRDYNPATFQLG